MQSSLNPQGPEAAVVAEMAWVLFTAGALILAAVVGLAAFAVFARRDRAARLGTVATVLVGGIAFPVVALAGLQVYSLVRAAALPRAGDGPALRIAVTGEQWWWRVHYLDAEGRLEFATANEIHIPAGRPVDLELRTADVIHSFWVPSLAGKLDMIPGRVNRLRIVASQPGWYKGQCAEFCGGPHGFMGLLVVAQEEDVFGRWAARQRSPAIASSPEDAGRALFEAHCAACHAVRGTSAAGTRGPDLTHVGGRSGLAAQRLSMSPATLESWISRSQHLKPGALMPQFDHFSAEELRAVAGYLAALH